MGDKIISRRRFLGLGTTLVAGALASSGYAACEATVPNKRSFPRIRFYPGIGIHAGGKLWEGDATVVQRLYD
jgi:hypothetical protein